VIERREEIAMSIREIIEETAESWGVQVESMLVKDIVFSQELQDSLSMAAQSKRTGEAKVIAARAEVESAKLMRQAADILSSPAAMQIRYLEVCLLSFFAMGFTRDFPLVLMACFSRLGNASNGQIVKQQSHLPARPEPGAKPERARPARASRSCQ